MTRLMLVGRLDLVTAPRAHTAIRRAQDETRALTCDLGDVWYVDFCGLHVLLRAAAHAKRTGAHLTLAGCPAFVARMLRLLKPDAAMEIHADRSSLAAPR